MLLVCKWQMRARAQNDDTYFPLIINFILFVIVIFTSDIGDLRDCSSLELVLCMCTIK
jgi:hypothetical protein